MTADSNLPVRERLNADVLRVLSIVPDIGKVMIGSSLNGVTHERIGPVPGFSLVDGWAVSTSASHDTRIDPVGIASIIVDRSSRMGDKAYPRIEFHNADGVVLFSVTGFEGLEPFDVALLPLGPGEPVEPPVSSPSGERGEVAPDDPGAVPLDEAQASGEEVTVGFRRPGFEQLWRGQIEAVKPAMGFINIIRGDFHLHLKAGVVKTWEADNKAVIARATDGSKLGLYVERAADA